MNTELHYRCPVKGPSTLGVRIEEPGGTNRYGFAHIGHIPVFDPMGVFGKDFDMNTTPAPTLPRKPLVDAQTRKKPVTVDLLNDWQYLERSLHRILAGWGRHVAGWDDKSALHRHIWEQSEIVRRLRARVSEFPGGKPDAAVSARLENLANAALLAPSLEDALDGVHFLIGKALVGAYVAYATSAHPVHDAPTIAMLHEINQIKAGQWLWFRDYRRRRPHATDPAYAQKLRDLIGELGGFSAPLPPTKPGARPAGVGTDFTLPKFSARDLPTRPRHDFMPYVRADFTTSLEARRLFWAYAYMLEKNLPDDQLSWVYYGHYMPWDWHADVSRHLWDESRHGDSGYSRLKDFGIDPAEVGFPSYNNDEQAKALDAIAGGHTTTEFADYVEDLADIPAEPMTPKDLYEAVFFIGMVAENGHFVVKNEAYKDFQDGKDMESAEMMLFDVIDETTHVQYAHRWLPLLAEHAGISAEGYRERAARVRAEYERGEQEIIAALKLSRDPADPAYAFYLDLLARIRRVAPLENADTCPARSPKPM